MTDLEIGEVLIQWASNCSKSTHWILEEGFFDEAHGYSYAAPKNTDGKLASLEKNTSMTLKNSSRSYHSKSLTEDVICKVCICQRGEEGVGAGEDEDAAADYSHRGQ